MTIKPTFTYTDDSGNETEVAYVHDDSGSYITLRPGELNDICIVDVADLGEFITALRSLVPENDRPDDKAEGE